MNLIEALLVYLLGYVIGVLSSIFFFLIVTRYTPELRRTLSRTVTLFGKKGAIINPEANEVEQWINELDNENV